MIYFASYFQPGNWHGQPFAISLGIPPALVDRVGADHPLRNHLAPSGTLLHWWKRQELRASEMGWEFPSEEVIDQYTNRYREEIRVAMPGILEWLQGDGPTQDQTWLCYERAGEFCHRNLVAAIVQKYRPDQFGGCDTPARMASKPPEVTQDDKTYSQGGQDPLSGLPDGASGTQIAVDDLRSGIQLRLLPKYKSDRVYTFLEVKMPVPGPGELPSPLCVMETPEGGRAYWYLNQLEVV